MLELLSPMTAVLLSWLLFFFVFSGLGAGALKAMGQSLSSGWLLLDGFWLGWAVTLGILQLWHFVFPVNEVILLLLAVAAILAWHRHRKDVARILRRLPRDRSFVLLAALLALWMSNRALGAPAAYDTGFRDMQAVLWLDTYPLVPGLGNLFSSLAFNQSIYLYDALLDAFIWSGRSHVIATGLLVSVYLLRALKSALSIYRCQTAGSLRWSQLFAALTMPYVLFYTAAWGGITHFLTDTAVDLLGFVSIIYLLDFLQDWRADNDDNDYLIYRLALVILAGFTIKQSFIIFGLALAVFAFMVWLRRCHFRPGSKRLARICLPIALAACAFTVPWLARGGVTSGYIAYPLSLAPLEVDWLMPAEQLQQRQLNMSANTRLRGGDREAVLGSWDWLGPWLRRFAGNFMPTMLPTLTAAAGLFLCALGMRRSRGAEQEEPHRLSLWLLTPLLAALLIWFLSYPEPKYARYIFWSLAAITVILALQAWHTLPWSKRKLCAFALAALCLAYVAYLIVQLGTHPLPAGPDRGFHPPPPALHTEFLTENGLTLNVPAGTMPQCWRIPLPCSPYPNAKLEARVPGDLRHGFRINTSAGAGAADA